MSDESAMIGYLDDKREFALISVFNVPLINPGDWGVQIALTIDGAMALRETLDEFLTLHRASIH